MTNIPKAPVVNLRPNISIEQKACSTCREKRPLADFYVRRVSKDGLQGKCKFCTRRSAYQWRIDNPEKAKAAEIKNNAKPESKVRQREFQWRKNLRNLGMTPDDYAVMLAAQGGGCALCGDIHADSLNRRLHVDHDHVTGVVRGILCSSCNLGIGKFEDDPQRLRAAADYLEKK